MCDILEQQAVPSVEVLVAPTLDQSIINRILHQNRKFVQDCDKEMAVIRRATLNITGPLCTVHYCLEKNIAVVYSLYYC